MRPEISVVVVSLNEGVHLRQTIEHLQASLPDRSEIIVVDDGSTDGSVEFLFASSNAARMIQTNQVGVARARNAGADVARGDILVFADAHISMQPGWIEPLIELLQNQRVGAVNPAVCRMDAPEYVGSGMRFSGPDLGSGWLEKKGRSPHPAPLLLWACAATRREVYEATGGFDTGMIRWGSIDNEMSLRLWLEGYELWVVPDVTVAHLFRTVRPYRVEWSDVLHNKLRLAFVHFESAHSTLVVDALRTHHAFPEALARTAGDDIPSRRRALSARKVHDSGWYFEKFGLAGSPHGTAERQEHLATETQSAQRALTLETN